MLRGLLLLVMTWLVDLPGTLLRLALFMVIGAPLGFLFGRNTFFVLPLLAFYPTIAMLLALAFPSGHLLTRRQLGARRPSERERQAIEPVLARFAEAGAPMPRHWYMIDGQTVSAFVIGSTLYIERGLLQVEHMASVIAHELGHLNTTDGRYTLAQRRLIIPLFLGIAEAYATTGTEILEMDQIGVLHKRNVPGGCGFVVIAFLSLLMGGGLGLLMFQKLWLMYWRDREYNADAYAARLGEAGQLAEVLDTVALPLDVAVPFMQNMTHPYTELRIDKLLRYVRDGAPMMPLALRPWLWRTIPTALLVMLLAPFAFGAFVFRDLRSGLSAAPPVQAAGVVRVPATPASVHVTGSASAPVQMPMEQRASPTDEPTSTPDTQAMIAAAVGATAEAPGLMPSETPEPTSAPTSDPVQAVVQGTVVALQTAQAEAAGPARVLHPDRVEAISSAYDGKDDAGNVISYGPANVVDGNPETAWRNDGGQVGQFLILRYNAPIVVNEIGIIPGYAKIDAATGINRFTQNRRVTRVLLGFEDGTQQFADLADSPTMQTIMLKAHIKTTFVEVVVMGVTASGGRDYTAISEIEVMGRPTR